jgi:predicted RNA methylase
MTLPPTEQQRLHLQKLLDAGKSQTERNKLGQFATPTPLAIELLTYARMQIAEPTSIRFLDPAFGTGSFYSALQTVFPATDIQQAIGYEIDPHYGTTAQTLWRNTPLKLYLSDFTRATPPTAPNERANLLICNPPYVRHHHLPQAEKLRLIEQVQTITSVRLNGLTGLYAYFLCLAHAWMADDGLAGWLIPSEFMDVNYGKQIKEYLLSQVTLLHVHRFDPQAAQFDDALVSSAIVWFRKTPPPANHYVKFSYGGTLTAPTISRMIPASSLPNTTKWTRFPEWSANVQTTTNSLTLSDLFTIKRGIATGGNAFFIVTPQDIEHYALPTEFLTPMLPSPRYVNTNEIIADQAGHPQLKQPRFLLTCNHPEQTIQTYYPTLWNYLQLGLRKGIHQGYLCQHRTPWYAQEQRPAAPIVSTYMGRQREDRKNPFRFILNASQATAPNVYLMLYPKPVLITAVQRHPMLIRTIWQHLNDLPITTLLGEGRVYGGGLYKLEPKELGNLPIDQLSDSVPLLARKPDPSPELALQTTLFE